MAIAGRAGIFARRARLAAMGSARVRKAVLAAATALGLI